jgi:hypothetical protein
VAVTRRDAVEVRRRNAGREVGWPSWIGAAAAAWSLSYGALGLLWALGGSGFPFGRAGDPSAALSVFRNARPVAGGLVIAALGLLGGVVGIAMSRIQGRGAVSRILVCFAWTSSAFLILIVPDYRPLLGLAYAPVILLGAPFDWPPDVGLLDVLPWPVLNQVLCIAGGVLWAGAALAFGRRARAACEHCGRPELPASWTAPHSAARWGRRAVAVAVVVPLLYAATRYAWALGIPLGISEEFLRAGQATGLWWAGAALATLAVAGSLLTLGLVRPWGEVFPRWVPFVAARRVPFWLAIIPASVVAILVTSAGLMFIRLVLTEALTEVFSFAEDVGWVALAPELLWPIWGVALGAATMAYYYRRRGRCRRCRRL